MKKRTVKIIATALAMAMSVGAFAGCKQNSDKDEQGRTILSVNGYPAKEGKLKDDIDKKIATFEAENPDVKIKPDQWTYDLKSFYAKAAGGQLPNVFQTAYTEAAQCIDSEYVADITEALNANGYGGKFNEKVASVVSRDGKMYAFPVTSYIVGLAYNTEMFEAAGLMEADGTPKQPKTWDETLEFAKKIKEATGKPGIAIASAGHTGGWLFTCLAWSFGVDFMEQDADGNWIATFDSEEAVNALQWVKDLKWVHDVVPSNTLLDPTEYFKTYATGGAGMILTPGDVPRKVTQYGMTPDKVGMLGLPAGPKRHVTLLGGTIFSISAASTEDQIDAGVRWIGSRYGYELTEIAKTALENSYEEKLAENQLIGIKSLNVWNDDAESVAFENTLIDKYANSNPNHVKLYNEFIKSDVEIQTEEPVCAQELYGVLDSCIQEVLTDENADCSEVLKKACNDFQKNYLDKLGF